MFDYFNLINLYYLLFYLGAVNAGVKMYKAFIYFKRQELEGPLMRLKCIRTISSASLHIIYLFIMFSLRVFISIDSLHPIINIIYLLPVCTIILKTIFEIGVNTNHMDKNMSNCIITLCIVVVYFHQSIFNNFEKDWKFEYYFISSSIYYFSINDVLWSILNYYIVPDVNYSAKRSGISEIFYLLILYLNMSCVFHIDYGYLCVVTILIYIITPIAIKLTLQHCQSFL